LCFHEEIGHFAPLAAGAGNTVITIDRFSVVVGGRQAFLEQGRAARFKKEILAPIAAQPNGEVEAMIGGQIGPVDAVEVGPFIDVRTRVGG